jgi:hypothetical protein
LLLLQIWALLVRILLVGFNALFFPQMLFPKVVCGLGVVVMILVVVFEDLRWWFFCCGVFWTVRVLFLDLCVFFLVVVATDLRWCVVVATDLSWSGGTNLI